MKNLFFLFLMAACSSHHPKVYVPDHAGIRRAFIEKEPELKDCALKFGRAEKTPYLYEFSITPEGKTVDHRITGPVVPSPDLENCVISKMAPLRFYPAEKASSVRQPINIWRNPK